MPTELEECVGALAYLSGVDLDLATVTDSRGRTALSIAASNGQIELAVALLRYYPTIPINAVDDDGYRCVVSCTNVACPNQIVHSHDSTDVTPLV